MNIKELKEYIKDLQDDMIVESSEYGELGIGSGIFIRGNKIYFC